MRKFHAEAPEALRIFKLALGVFHSRPKGRGRRFDTHRFNQT
jgi:hypothetical protein